MGSHLKDRRSKDILGFVPFTSILLLPFYACTTARCVSTCDLLGGAQRAERPGPLLGLHRLVHGCGLGAGAGVENLQLGRCPVFFLRTVCVCVCACVLLLMGSSTKGHLECGCLLLHFLEPSDNPLVILYYRCFLNRGTCLGEGPISIHSHAFLPGQHMICQTLGRAKRKWAVSHVLYEWVSLGVMGSARARASEPGRASAHLWVNLIRDLLQQVRRQGWNGRNIQANDPSLKWAKLQRDNQARLPKSCVHMRGALPGKIQGSRKTTCWHRRLVVLLGACHAHDSRFQGVDQGFTFELCIQTRALPVDIDVPGFFMFVPWWFRRSLKQMFLIANEALSSQELSISHGFRRFFPTRAAPSLKAGSSESPHQEPPEAASWASSDAAAAGLVRGIVPASVFT